MAAMLDELMGPERNVPLDKRTNRKRHFTDPDICKFYICGLSPHFLFKNTKSADDVWRILGDYQMVADDKVKGEWEAVPQEEKDKYGCDWPHPLPSCFNIKYCILHSPVRSKSFALVLP